MFGRVGNFFDRTATVFNTYVPIKNGVTDFFAKYTLFEVAEQMQMRDFSDLRVAKLRVWQEWVDELVGYCNLAGGWACLTQPDIVEQLNVSEERLLHMSQEASADKGRDLVRILKIYQTSLIPYGISEDMLDMVEEKITGFTAMIPDLSEAIKVHKDSTEDLRLAIAEVDRTLVVLDKLIKGKYKLSKPDLWREYRVMRELSQTPSHHTGLRVTVYHEGTTIPMQGATAVIRELNRSAITNIDGVAEILEFRNGKYHVDLMVDGVVKKTLIVAVKRGKVAEITEAL